MFTDDLLQELSNSGLGLRLACFLFNNFAYADDITLLAACVPGLQGLKNICTAYAKKWRFVFCFAKTKCITLGSNILAQCPTWRLDGNTITTTDRIDILGVKFCIVFYCPCCVPGFVR